MQPHQRPDHQRAAVRIDDVLIDLGEERRALRGGGPYSFDRALGWEL